MEIKELGHVVLYVTDLNKMVDFYSRVLGFQLIGKNDAFAAFSSGRTHHEMLLIEIGKGYQRSQQLQPGLYHIGFKIGDTEQELKDTIVLLQKENVVFVGTADHHVTKSVYILDPDGNELELYIDSGVDWKTHPEALFKPPKALILN